MFKLKNMNTESINLEFVTSREDFLEDDIDFTKNEVAEFLHEHLGRFGDPLEDIIDAIDYALSDEKGKGGFVLVLHDQDEIIGSVVINNTGMNGYIPENILVYIAVHDEYRGKGIGGNLIKETAKKCKGDIALHVEYDNPARKLYERSGFKSKYAEMRLKN
ncbi:GNAT family N-acetyltransferase [Oceanotoga sp. DSM 15011]|uniref:Acetyltransferase (GNAT) family protein n=1 Tax=Oceanotoga teriensis TaxID=515440 RepID=A0AA45C5L4_9BACT|nr:MULTISPECIES: GNAT family N-acetyltransferase [Oceanotoga]MDO7976429.1 GNAT family N-acetyltransferase [Oceanotoga teriensis]PWJ89031.1 acetyltransferase (GNAT) family protein [Oceanotoga teriensis]UYP01395.1 GNAT family N-acetyltransferase [Oceanotoga sp. DSM 15011]